MATAALTEATAGAFVRVGDDGRAHLDLLVEGARCAGCIKKIERAALALPSVADARLNLTAGRLRVAFQPGVAIDADDVVRSVQDAGYQVHPFEAEAVQGAAEREWRQLLFCLGVAAFASMNVMLLSVSVWAGFGEMGDATRQMFYAISGVIAIPAALYAGQPFFISAIGALRRGHANMDVPISIAVILTLVVSVMETALGGQHAFFDGVVMLLFLLLIGRALDYQLRQKARSAAADLIALQATSVTRLRADGVAETVPARAIAPDDRLLLSQGERIAVDATVEVGASDVDRSLVTGESTPFPVRVGDLLHAGTINLSAPLRVRAVSTIHASLLADLARLIEAGEQKRSAHRRFADRAAELYVPIVHTLAIVTFGAWMWFGDGGLRDALMKAAAVLIITCPCALGLAAPAVQIVANGRLFRQGILVKSADALERLAAVTHVILDKTGTLTLGQPALASGIEPNTLRRAAALARHSRHPLARAIVAAAGPGTPALASEEHVGRGVSGVIEGLPARLGSAEFVGAAPDDASAAAQLCLWFRLGDQTPILIEFEDPLRVDAIDAIAALRKRGLSVEILSGDRPEAVAAVAHAVGVATFDGGVSGEAKAAHVQRLELAGARVLMVGDGLNDSAALAIAHASAAPGAAVDVAQSASDIVFQGPRLMEVPEALDVARRARARMLENFSFSALYNIAAIPFAAFGFVTPLIAALAMAGSSIVVMLNALRLQGTGR